MMGKTLAREPTGNHGFKLLSVRLSGTACAQALSGALLRSLRTHVILHCSSPFKRMTASPAALNDACTTASLMALHFALAARF